MLMRTHGIIFDCDGTLIDTFGRALEWFNYSLGKMGEKPRTMDEIKIYFGVAADRIFVKLLGDERRGLEAFEHYMTYAETLAPQIPVHEGIRELLELLKKENVPMAIVTGRHSRDLDVGLAPHKLAEYFQTLVADNQVPHPKPAPDGILLAASRLGLDPRHCLYVGDSVTDLQAAHNAGATAVAVLWDSVVKPDEMAKERPRYMAKTPMDVWTSYLDFTRTTYGV